MKTTRKEFIFYMENYAGEEPETAEEIAKDYGNDLRAFLLDCSQEKDEIDDCIAQVKRDA